MRISARLLVKGEVLRRNDKRTHSITSGNQLQYKYAIGTIVKKEQYGKFYSGEVVNRGFDDEKKTYEIYYAEDGDREILCEQQLLEIVVNK